MDFEDHCWQDVIPPETAALYKDHQRETFVGQYPVLLAIDLFNARLAACVRQLSTASPTATISFLPRTAALTVTRSLTRSISSTCTTSMLT